MKTLYQIMEKAIETSRTIGHTELEKDIFKNKPYAQCCENDNASKQEREEAKKINERYRLEHEEKLLEYDFKINSLGTELNTLLWLFSDKKEDN